MVLPKAGGPYKEWEASLTKSSSTGRRDAERFLRGKGGVVYYTSDHYQTAQLITKGNAQHEFPVEIKEK